MKNNKKTEKVYGGKKGFPIKKGISLGTVYRINPNTADTYELLNFGFCSTDNSFYFNKNLSLPEDMVKRIEKLPVSEETSKFLLDLGFYAYDDVNMLLNQYSSANEHVEAVKRRILNIKDTLKKEDK